MLEPPSAQATTETEGNNISPVLLRGMCGRVATHNPSTVCRVATQKLWGVRLSENIGSSKYVVSYQVSKVTMYGGIYILESSQ